MIDPNRIARLAAIEQQYGLPRSTLAGMYGIESNYGRAKDRPGSQFQGGFQLGNAVRRQYGITNPQDFEQSAMGAAMYARDNAKFLRSKLGRDPTPADLYLAHQQGPGGAVKLLSHPDTPAGMLTNPNFIRSNAGDPNAPASAFTKMFGDKFSSKAAMAAQGSPMGEAMAYTNEAPVNRGAAIDAINAMAGGPSQDPLAGSAMSSGETPDTGWEAAGNIGNGLMMAGAALMARDNPAGAQALMAGIRAKQKAQKSPWDMHFDARTGQVVRMNPDTGEVSSTMVPGFKPAADTTDLPPGVREAEWYRTATPEQREAYDKLHPQDAPPDPKAVKALTRQVLAGNTKVLARQNDKVRQAVWAGASAEEERLGLPPGYIQQQEAEQAYRTAAEREYGKADTRRNTAANQFLAGATTLLDLNEKVDRDGTFTLNRVLNWKERELQNPDYAALQTGINTLVNEYANAISVTGAPTKSDKEHAREMLTANYGNVPLAAVVKTMTQEVVRSKEMVYQSNMNRRARAKGQEVPYPDIEGPDAGGGGVPKSLQEKIDKQIAPAQEAPKQTQGPQTISDKAAYDALPSGAIFVGPDGKKRRKP